MIFKDTVAMTDQAMQINIKKLEKIYERNEEQVRTSRWYPQFHFASRAGWINDPNGLVFFQGEYHLFYQAAPQSLFWSEVSWGHATSADLIHWNHVSLALAPSESYDDDPRGGCFSGSPIVWDDKLWLFYTGCTYGRDGFLQTQCMAWSEDGIHFHKSKLNPLICAPKGVKRSMFRDPKVWRDTQNDCFFMVVGCEKDDGNAAALLYTSTDLFSWTYVNILFESRGEWGHMWECPNFFQIENRWVFSCSPMGAGLRTAVYFVGDFDAERGRFFPAISGAVDYGFDCYAGQEYLLPDGRHVMLSWANEWEWMPFFKDWGPTYKDGWSGFFCFPREIQLLGDGTLAFPPIREIEQLRTNKAEIGATTISDGEYLHIPLNDGTHFELECIIDSSSPADRMVVHARSNMGRTYETRISLDFTHAKLLVNRGKSDGWSRGEAAVDFPIREEEPISLTILSDTSSVEIFAADGRYCQSVNVFPEKDCSDLSIEAVGGEVRLLSCVGYKMTL